MAVTVNQTTPRADDCRNGLPVAASTNILEGTLVFADSNGRAADDTGSGANPFAGVAVAQQDNSGGGAEALQVEVHTEGKFLLVGTGFTQATVGKRIYATDNYTVTADGTTANAVPIGKCAAYVSSTKIWVEIEPNPLTLPVVQGAAYTQTYSTAARTVPAEVAAITGGESPTEAEHNLLVADVLALKKLVNALIDDLQAVKIAA